MRLSLRSQFSREKTLRQQFTWRGLSGEFSKEQCLEGSEDRRAGQREN